MLAWACVCDDLWVVGVIRCATGGIARPPGFGTYRKVRDSWFPGLYFLHVFSEGAQTQGTSAKRDPPLVLYHNLSSEVIFWIDAPRNHIPVEDSLVLR